MRRKPQGKEGMAAGPQLVTQRPEIGDLPCSPEIERIIIGGILKAEQPNDTYRQVRELVPMGAFSLEDHKRLIWAMGDLDEAGLAITLPLVVDVLGKKNQLSNHTIISDFADMARVQNLESYCAQVATNGAYRQLYLNCLDIQNRIVSHDPLAEIMSDAKRRLDGIHASNGLSVFEEIPSVIAMDVQVEFAVQGIVMKGGITAIGGEPGDGKSTFALALAGAVATGQPFMGRPVIQMPVIYLDRENPVGVVKERCVRLRIQDGGELKIWGGWCPQGEAQAPAELFEAVRRMHPKPMIVVDSYRAFFEGDENDAAVVCGFMHPLRRLADIGATIVMLHHPGKGETSRDYRGSADFKARLDTGYRLTNYGDNRLDRLMLKLFKVRYGMDDSIVFRYANDEFVADERPAAAEANYNAQLTKLLRENPGITSRRFEDMASKGGLTRQKAREYLRHQMEFKQVRMDIGRANAHRYTLIDFDALPERYS